MSKIMWILGLILTTLGVLLGVKSIISPGQMQIYGLTPETAAILLVGGIVSIGLGSVINALGDFAGKSVAVPQIAKAVVAEIAAQPAEDIPTRIPGFGRKTAEAAGAAAAVAGAAMVETKSTANAAASTTTSSVADTIAALEQANSDIKTALGALKI